MKKKENNVQFRKNGSSGKAVGSLITGIVTAVTFLVLIFWSGIKEETPQVFAIVATAALVISFIGLLVSIGCIREQEGSYAVPYAGMAVNGITFITYMTTYILGLV